MFSRKCVFACVLLVYFSGITYAQRESALRPAEARPTPKPSPTPTDADGNPVGGKGGGTHLVTGRNMLLAMATPTPKPTPSDPDATPVTGKPGGPHAIAQFNGAWTLDKARSGGLSPRMQGADRVTWTIRQDDKTISIDQKVEGGQPPAGGGGGGGTGGGGGMGGGRPPGGPTAYKLDGSDVTSDVTFGQNAGKQTLKATWSGDALELSRKTTFTTDQGDRTSTNTQKLSLSADGKVLTAAVHSEGGRGGPTDSTLVFNKQ